MTGSLTGTSRMTLTQSRAKVQVRDLGSDSHAPRLDKPEFALPRERKSFSFRFVASFDVSSATNWNANRKIHCSVVKAHGGLWWFRGKLLFLAFSDPDENRSRYRLGISALNSLHIPPSTNDSPPISPNQWFCTTSGYVRRSDTRQNPPLL